MHQDDFDPYRKWLGIPPRDQPPNHYRLLSLGLFEDDPDTISNAADRQMAHLRTFQTGPHSALSQRLLNECAAARLCLLKPEEKAKYDELLRKEATPAANSVSAPPTPIPVPTSPQSTPPPPTSVALPHQSAPPRMIAAASPPAPEAPIRFNGPSPVRQLVRRKKSSVGPVIISVACSLALLVGLFVFWRSQENQYAGGGKADSVTKDQPPVTAVASVKSDADLTAPSIKPRTDGAANGNPEMMGGEDSEEQGESAPGEANEIDRSASEMPAESSPTNEATSEADAPAKKATDGESTVAIPPDEPEPAPAGEMKSTKPKRTTAVKKPSTPRRPRFVPNDAIFRGGHWYWFSTDRATPEEAQQHAMKVQGRLVTISSAEENAVVAEHLKGPTFIGMLKSKKVWMNSAGGFQQYFNWDLGQPSSGRGEIYAAIHPNGVWHDYLRDSLFYCIEWGKEP